MDAEPVAGGRPASTDVFLNVLSHSRRSNGL